MAFLDERASNLYTFIVLIVTIAGGVLCYIAIKRLRSEIEKKANTNLVIYAIVIGAVSFILYGITVPGMIVMRRRAKEFTVKQVAHVLQVCVEDYKTKNNGERPKSVQDLEASLPESVKVKTYNDYSYKVRPIEFFKKVNPFNPKQTYTVSGGGLVDGEPSQKGQIGYFAPSTPTKPYRIIAGYVDDDKTLPLLTLIEEQPNAESDSSVTKRP